MSPCRVAVLQSNYVPWKGCFELIHDVDVLVVYDDNQHIKNDWRNRNKRKSAQATQRLTIPVGEWLDRPICEVTRPESGWQAKLWRTIEQQYSGSPHVERFRSLSQDIYLGRTLTHLSALNQHLIKQIAREVLGITTRFANSRAYAAVGAELAKLMSLVSRTGDTRFVSGPAARDDSVVSRFFSAGIELKWKSHAGDPEYSHRHALFEHSVSILDLIFNVGPDAPWYIWGWRYGASP